MIEARLASRRSSIRAQAVLAALVLLALPAFGPLGCRTVTGEFAFDVDVPEPVEALAWARDKYDPDKRRTALKWLAHAPWAGAEVYISIYESLAEDPDPTVRAAALFALARHGRPDHAQLVGLRLELDPNESVRLQAARTLQRLHHPEAVEPLQRAMQSDPDSWVRAEAAKALGQYANRELLPALIQALDDEKLEVAAGARRSLVYLTGRDFRY
ncbi:MAG: HEAT repeat domain-containing protein, partial [Phycisphaerales bacterium JB038]